MELFLYSLLTCTFALMAFLPYFSKQDILFGYRISEDLAERSEVKELKRWYARTYLLVFGLLAIGMYWIGPGVAILLLTPGFLIIQYTIYRAARSRARQFVAAHREEIQLQRRVVVSTEQGRMSVSPFWFAIPLLMILVMFILSFTMYDRIPERLPMRYDFQGNVTGYDEKTPGSVLLLPSITLIANLMLIFVYVSIWQAKRELSGKDLEAARIRSERFRKAMAGLMVYMAIVLTLLFFLQFLRSSGMIPFHLTMFTIEMILFPIMLVIPPIVISIRVGQSGSRIKVQKTDQTGRGEILRADDQYWKWGLFYYNPDDPSIWIEKRMGIGYTVNFARPGAWLVMGVILVYILLSVVLPQVFV